MNTLELDALLVELAGMKCPLAHEGHEGYMDGICTGKPCHACHGTGYLFPGGVRVPCSCLTKTGCSACANPIRFQHGSWCLVCAGRGWTPSLDFVTWAIAAQELGVAFCFYSNGGHAAIHWGQAYTQKNPLQALLTALAAAVKP